MTEEVFTEEHCVRTIVRDILCTGVTDLEEVKKTYQRNQKMGMHYDKMIPESINKPEVARRIMDMSPQIFERIVGELIPLNFEYLPKCPIFVFAYTLHNGMPPGRFDMDASKRLMCHQQGCEWWSKKNKRCYLTMRGRMVNMEKLRESILAGAALMQKPVDYLVHSECISCKNFNTQLCATCPVVPRNYQPKEK
jgi:hypothetical protein